MLDDSGPREFGNWLAPHLDSVQPGMQVVELGCGLGADALEMTSFGLHVTAMDLELKRIRQAAIGAPVVHFVVGDLRTGLPFTAGCADLLVASLSLHYFDGRTTASILRDAARVLRPDGLLLCRVNVAGETTALWGQGIEHEPDFFEVEPGRFKRFFTPDSLQSALSECFDVQLIEMQRTSMSYGDDKRTLVARARRKE